MGRKAKAGKGGGRGKKSRKLKVPSSVAPSPGGGDMPRAKAAGQKDGSHFSLPASNVDENDEFT